MLSTGPGVEPPPPDPSAPAGGAGTDTVLAVRKLYLGAKDWSGQVDVNFWKRVGYDVDGLVSEANSANHCCILPSALAKQVKTDGNGGIDNSFGAYLVPVLMSFAADPEIANDAAIAGGQYTWLFRFTNLGAEPNQNHLHAALYVGANRGAPAKWDGSDIWPVTFESVTGGAVDSPVVSLDSYLVGGTWVSGPAPISAVMEVHLVVESSIETLRIHFPRITMKLSGAGSSAEAVQGIVSGVLDTEEVVSATRKFALALGAASCSTDLGAIEQVIRGASDIMKDGTNGDPNEACDGISIGLGFEASAALLGVVAPPAQPEVDPCGG